MSVNSFHLILVCHFLYYYTVTHFADLETLAVSNWSVVAHIPVGAIVSSFVQIFYAYRLYLLNGRRPVVPAAIAFFSLLQTAMRASLAVKISKIRYFEKERQSQPYVIGALACECLCAIIITLSNKLQAMVQYAVNTGAVTTAIAVASVVSWVIAPDALVDAALYIVIIRLYPCSFLSIINSRCYPPDIGDITMEGPESHMSFLDHSTTTYQDSARHITQASSSSSGVKYSGSPANQSH
ncbi:hypothetical protein DFS33DRAFT_563097 [Desarmillaria ectypa]|nr:hypothetical protein DFS33DRAFT_563097 [Desarmillaria ectypa]